MAQKEALKSNRSIQTGQGVFEESSTQKAVLGTRVAFNDGRVFRYCQANGALTAGKLAKSPSPSSDAVNKPVYAAVAAGNYEVTMETASAQTGVEAEEGFLLINDAAGEGLMYKIKKATANTTTSTYSDLELYDPVVTALTTSSEGTIIPCPYSEVAPSTAVTDLVCGVPPIPVTDNYYFWIQTWGWCPLLCEGTPAAGYLVFAAATDGAVTGVTHGAASLFQKPLGWQYVVGVDTEYRLTFLQIAP